VLINYCNYIHTGYTAVTFQGSTRRSFVTPGRVAAAGIYAGAAGYGFAIGGPAGAIGGLLAVPEVVTIPLIVA
jgi:hypothetical protein